MGSLDISKRKDNEEEDGQLDKREQQYLLSEEKEGRMVSHLTWRHWFLGPIAFLYFTGFNMGMFIIGQYIYRRIQQETFPNKTFVTSISYCDVNYSNPDVFKLIHVQKEAARWNIVYSVIAGVPSIFTNVLLGSYTDRFGRKFLFILGISGTLLRMIINVIGIYISMDLWLFAIGFALEGLTGQVFSVLLASYAYAADVTTRSQRSIGIVLVEVSVGLGTTIPAVASGYFLQGSGFKYPMILAAAIVAVALLASIFILPESYPAEKRRRPKKTCINVINALGLYFSRSNAGKRLKYTAAILAFFFTMMDLLGRTNVETLYQMNAPFCWDPERLGIFGALRSGLQQVVGMILVKLFKAFMTDESIAIVGAVSYAAGFIMEGLAKSSTVIYIVTVIGSCGLLTIPMIRSIMSKLTSPDQQGAVTASISMVETACNVFSSIMFSSIYSATVGIYGGAIFFVMAAFNVITLVLLVLLKVGSDRGQHKHGGTARVIPQAYAVNNTKL